MKNKDEIKAFLEYFQSKEEQPLEFNEKAILAEYYSGNQNQTLAIKILSVFGGFLASLAFLGFLGVVGLFESATALIAFGGIFIGVSIWIHIEFDTIILDTLSISSYIIGFFLVGFGCYEFNLSENMISWIFIILALVTLNIVQTYILSFVSILIINGSILTLLLSNDLNNFIHLYLAVLAFSMTYLFLKEAKFITTKDAISKWYEPLKAALIISFLAVLVCLGKKGLISISTNYIWISSIILIGIILYLISYLFPLLKITTKKHQIGIYIFTAIALLPTALSPAISGTILLILLSFLINYKTGFGLGIISFLYFISQYYYDLNFTLLTKSILLFSTGTLFIGVYLFTYKKLTANEKV